MGRAGVWLLLGLWMICFVFWRFQGGFVSGFLFYAMSILGLYEGLVWLAGGIGWTVEAEVEKRLWTKGDAMDVLLRIRRRLPMPFIWLRAEPVLPRRLWGAYRPQASFRLMWFARDVVMTYQLRPLPRGKFVLSSVQLTWGDLFGFVHHRRRLAQELEFVVFPRWRPLRHWPLAAGDATGSPGAKRRPLKTLPETGTVSGVRDWQPGDRLSQIHWKASARSASLKTKRSEVSGNSTFLLLLDLSRDSYPEGDGSLLERGVELVLSLAYAAMAHGLAVGLWAEGRETVRVEPKTDAQHLNRLAFALAQVEADGARSVSSLLRSMPTAGGKAELVIITPQLEPTLVEAIRRMPEQYRTACHVFWLTGSGNKKWHPVQLTLRQQGVAVYPVDDVEGSSVFAAVSNKWG